MAHLNSEQLATMARDTAKMRGAEMMTKGMTGSMMGDGMGGMMGPMMGEGMGGMMGPMMGEGMGGMMGPMMGEGMGRMMAGMRGVAPATGMLMTGAAAGPTRKSLARRFFGNPYVLLALGLTAGYLIYKYRSEIIAAALGVADDAATLSNAPDTLEDLVQGD